MWWYKCWCKKERNLLSPPAKNGTRGEFKRVKKHAESKEVGVDTSSFFFLLGCVGLGGEQAEQKLEEEKKEKEYHEN